MTSLPMPSPGMTARRYPRFVLICSLHGLGPTRPLSDRPFDGCDTTGVTGGEKPRPQIAAGDGLLRGDPEPLQQGGRRMAVGHHAEFRLEVTNGVALIEIQSAGEIADLMAERGHLALQGDAGVARELRVRL